MLTFYFPQDTGQAGLLTLPLETYQSCYGFRCRHLSISMCVYVSMANNIYIWALIYIYIYICACISASISTQATSVFESVSVSVSIDVGPAREVHRATTKFNYIRTSN